MLDGQGEALDLELTPTRASRLRPQDGLLAHTNHFVAEDLLGEERSSDIDMHDSQTRMRRIGELLGASRGKLNLEHMQAILRDRANCPEAICHAPGDDDTDLMTFASFIAQPTPGNAWIAVGPPNEHSYHLYSFTD